MPVRLSVCGLPVALSVMVIVPGCAPVAVGVKVTLIVQLALTARVDGLMGQLFVCAYWVLAATLVTVRGAVPELVSVMVCAALVEFTF